MCRAVPFDESVHVSVVHDVILSRVFFTFANHSTTQTSKFLFLFLFASFTFQAKLHLSKRENEIEKGIPFTFKVKVTECKKVIVIDAHEEKRWWKLVAPQYSFDFSFKSDDSQYNTNVNPSFLFVCFYKLLNLINTRPLCEKQLFSHCHKRTSSSTKLCFFIMSNPSFVVYCMVFILKCCCFFRLWINYLSCLRFKFFTVL